MSPMEHLSLARSYVISPNSAGPSAVVRKLLILDASWREALIYSLPQQMAQSAVWLAGMGRWTHVAMSIFSKSVALEAGLPACTFYRGISFYINMQRMEWPQFQQDCTPKPQLNRLCLQMLIYAKYSWRGHFQLHWKHQLALTWVCGPGAPTRQMCAWSWHFKKDSPMRGKKSRSGL